MGLYGDDNMCVKIRITAMCFMKQENAISIFSVAAILIFKMVASIQQASVFNTNVIGFYDLENLRIDIIIRFIYAL